MTREQRYELVEGKQVEVVGVSIPVWVWGNETSEPATELFCKYTLTNQAGKTKIMPFNEGYLVNMPQPTLNRVPQASLSNEEWRGMSPSQQERWYDNIPEQKTGQNLRDIRDGGSEYLRLEGTKRMQREGKAVTLYHVIEIRDMHELTGTDTCIN